jgi:hypothetical protein
MKTTLWIPSVASPAVVLLFVTYLAGQSTFGSLTGTVTDQTGAVISNAVVTVTNEGTGIERRVTTNDTGVYNVPDLNVGAYRVLVEVKGFRSQEGPGWS